jgi:hypothetical protein
MCQQVGGKYQYPEKFCDKKISLDDLKMCIMNKDFLEYHKLKTFHSVQSLLL